MATNEQKHNAVKYYNGIMSSTYASQAERNETANVKSAVKAIKMLMLAVVAGIVIATTSGCGGNGNIVSDLVCSTQSDPSIVCPHN